MPRRFPSSQIVPPSAWAKLQFPVALHHIWSTNENHVPIRRGKGKQEEHFLWKINKLIDFWCFFISWWTSRIQSESTNLCESPSILTNSDFRFITQLDVSSQFSRNRWTVMGEKERKTWEKHCNYVGGEKWFVCV